MPAFSSLDRFFAVVFPLATALVVTAGCDFSGADSAVKAAPPEPTPEERFESLVAALKRQIEDSDLASNTAAAGYDAAPGTPVPTAQVRVTHELVPPASEADPYRGSVCLITKSKVMVILPEQTEEEAQEEKAKREAKLKKMEDDLDGVADLESLALPSRGVTDTLGKNSNFEIEPDATPSCYELEYRDGAWVLLTELDEENEPFYAAAIKYALMRQ